MKLYRLILFCFLWALCLLALGGCCVNHKSEVLPAVAATCTETGLTEGAVCAKCGEILVAQETVAVKEHSEVTVRAIPKTCTEAGRTAGIKCGYCDTVIKGLNVIPAEHEAVIEAGYAATCLARGLTDGSHCSDCNTVIAEQTVVERLPHHMQEGSCTWCGYNGETYRDPVRYISDACYSYLGACEKGDQMQAMYREVDAALSAFHTDTTRDAFREATVLYAVAVIDYGAYDLTLDEAIQVWNGYRDDHPLYYWLHYGYNYNTTTAKMVFKTTEEYKNGSDRAVYNEMIYDGLEALIAAGEEAPTAYDLALALYDAIVENCSYAYSEEGSGSEASLWAHSILGFFERGAFVCEGYAKLFQMLLTYYGVDNYYVHGDGHVWNLAQMNDGNWYWFDATWDDTGNIMATHRYFCVNDTQMVNWRDQLTLSSAAYGGNESFLASHTPYVPTMNGGEPVLDANDPTLPARPTAEFDRTDTLELRERFEYGGCSYVRLSYDTVQLVKAVGATDLVVPETVYYGNMALSVVAVGAINSSNLFVLNGYVTTDAVTVTLPEGVEIKGLALSAPSIESIYYS